MEVDLVNVHRAGIVHQAAKSLSSLPTICECEKFINDEISIQCIVNYENEPCLHDPDANVYFGLE